MLRRIALVIGWGGVLALPAFFLWLERRLFRLDRPAIVFSLGSTVLFAAVAIGLTLLADRKDATARRRLLGYVCLSLLTLVLTFTVLVYVGSLASNSFWGDSLAFDLVLETIRRPWFLLDLGGIPEKSQFLTLVGFAASVIAIYVAIFLAARQFYVAIRNDLHNSSKMQVRTQLTLLTFSIAGSLAICLFLVKTMPDRLVGEPLLSFFKVVNTSGMMGLDHRRMLSAFEDSDARSSYPVRPAYENRNLIIIFSDALRADHTGPYGYHRDTTPFLTALVKNGHAAKIDMALSTCSESFCGIGSTLASRPFHQLSVGSFKINQLLQSVGFQVDYWLSGDHRAWPFLWDFYGKEINRIHDSKSRNSESLDDRPLVEEFANMAAHDGTPRFMYFFLMSSHFSGIKLPEFKRFVPADVSPVLVSSVVTQKPASFDDTGVPLYPALSEEARQNVINRYDNGILQADKMIERLFATLREKGLLDNSTIMITGDHGEALGERGELLHGKELYQNYIRIPLIVYDQKLEHYQNREFATLLDIAPTLVDRVGLPIPKTWKGMSLLQESSERETVHQTRWRERPCTAIVKRSSYEFKKYIRCLYEKKIESEQLFDLNVDPGEETNLIKHTDAAELDSFREKTSQYVSPKIFCEGSGDSCTKY